jgi:FkbM family methyltransferase
VIEELEFALQYVENFGIAIDGGANAGEWSQELASKFDEVYAFEPHAGAFSNLAKNMRHTNNVRLIEQALGNDVCDVGLHCRRKVGFTDAYVDFDGEGTQMVPLDRYGLVNVGLIKLDLEGSEYFALQGASETIRNNKPIIIIENIPKFEKRFDLEKRAAVRYLEALDYEEVGRFPPNRVFKWSKK